MHSFGKLTPVNDTDLTIYQDALDYVINNNDVKNVAISGAYSAGKSSVLETYKLRRQDLKFLHISLAHFESVEDKKTVLDEKSLEGKVLNQLIHQIPPERIPRTNFKVKQKLSGSKIIRSTVLIMLFVIIVTYLRFFSKWSKFISALNTKWLKLLFTWTTNSTGELLIGVVCVVLLGLGVYTVVRATFNRSGMLKRVNLQGNEIEVFEQTEDSYFDKHLNEVLYLFENAGVNVIVFEDMDRYNSSLIFEKLREINTLVNSKKPQADEQPIRFFYLLKDDIFVSKDRTKFFDFILPIVPVIDASNSYDKFIEQFKVGGIYDLFDEFFLQRLSLYVDDMRLLKNIYNELLIYRGRLESINLDANRLLSLVTYKNIFPRDFSELQLGRGFIHTLFSNKPSFVDKEVQRTEEEIRLIEHSLRQAESELLNSFDELDANYFCTDMLLSVNNTRASQFPSRAEFIRAIKTNPSQVRSYNEQYRNWQPINVDNQFSQLTNNEEYRQRRDVIAVKSEDKIECLQSRLQELRKETVALKSRRLRDIINKNNVDEIFSVNFTNALGDKNDFQDIKNSQYFDLIKYLVRNGYIDETYPDYMTYFYEHSLSRCDKIFLRSVTDEIKQEYTYSLKNPRLVLSRLRLTDFEHQEILNFDLLEYLLETSDINSDYLEVFLEQLMKTRNYEFIGEFLERQADRGRFVFALNSIWPGAFKGFLAESGFNNTQKINYAVDTLLYSDDRTIQAVNEHECLSTFISEQPSFLNIENPNVTKLIDGFVLINVRFLSIDFSASNKELFDAVYRNSRYHLTFELICIMLGVVYNLPTTNDFKTSNYTLVTSKPYESLAEYVEENIKEYLGVVLDNCDGHISDEEFAAVKILNNPDVDIEQKKAYIGFLNTEISRITNVEDDGLWTQLLQHGHVFYSEENILNYFFLSGPDLFRGVALDSSLIQFINSGVTDPSFVYSDIDNKFGDDAGTRFYKAIVTCGDLENRKYESILKSLHRQYDQFQFKGLHADKIRILIQQRIIVMNEANLLFMRENYAEHVVAFIVRNISKYTADDFNEDLYNLPEVLLVLDEAIDDRFKIKLLEMTPDALTIKEKNYSDAIKQHILSHNFDLNDVPYLLKVCSREHEVVRDEIKRIAVQNIDHIIQEGYPIDDALLSDLLTASQLDDDKKKELFTTCLPMLSRNQVESYLRALHMEDFLSLFNGKRPRFEATPINYEILLAFKAHDWITKFDEEEDCYRAIGRKVRFAYKTV